MHDLNVLSDFDSNLMNVTDILLCSAITLLAITVWQLRQEKARRTKVETHTAQKDVPVEEHEGRASGSIKEDFHHNPLVPYDASDANLLASADVPGFGLAEPIGVAPNNKLHGESQFQTQVRVFQATGSSDHEFHDAASCDSRTGVFAIADGATVSICQREWAETLTECFTSLRPDLSNSSERGRWWEQCLDRWDEKVAPRLEVWRSDPRQFWTASKLYNTTGACATFLGFFLEPPTEGSEQQGYKLYVVGDCCAFWFKRDIEVAMQPLVESFNFNPSLLSVKRGFPVDKMQHFSHSSLPGNLLILATDALAKYLVTQRPWEHTSSFWTNILSFDDNQFEQWTNHIKSRSLLDPDDYTLVLIRFE